MNMPFHICAEEVRWFLIGVSPFISLVFLLWARLKGRR